MTFLTIKNMRLAEDTDPAIAETIAFFRSLGAEIHELGPALRYSSLRMPFWNVNRIFVERACTYETLVGLTENVNALGYPYAWILAEAACDEIAQDFLQGRGFLQTAQLTSMVCDAAASQAMSDPCCHEYPLQKSGLMIDFLQECFSFPGPCAKLFLEKIQAQRCPIHCFFGKHNGKIGSCGWLFAGREQAGIFYIGTKKEARNQGMAHAMVQTLLHKAKQLGYRQVVLTALGSARKLYEKSGFYALQEYRGFSPIDYTSH